MFENDTFVVDRGSLHTQAPLRSNPTESHGNRLNGLGLALVLFVPVLLGFSNRRPVNNASPENRICEESIRDFEKERDDLYKGLRGMIYALLKKDIKEFPIKIMEEGYCKNGFVGYANGWVDHILLCSKSIENKDEKKKEVVEIGKKDMKRARTIMWRILDGMSVEEKECLREKEELLLRMDPERYKDSLAIMEKRLEMREYNQEYRERMLRENPEEFRLKNRKSSRAYRARQIEQDPDKFEEKRRESARKYWKRKLERDPQTAEMRREAVRNYQKRKMEEDPKEYKRRRREIDKKYWEMKKIRKEAEEILRQWEEEDEEKARQASASCGSS